MIVGPLATIFSAHPLHEGLKPCERLIRLLTMALLLFGTVALLSAPACVQGAGGSGGDGGSTKPLEVRVTGYITAIDYETGLVHVGVSYYGSATVLVTSSTKISLDNLNSALDLLEVGDCAEVRYDWYTKVANKIAAISF
ncbi:MAG: hypothetical protein ACKV0T_24780 [Planctomycetales bacterium]